jgi:glutamate formiminotransferase/formiminotetrahydrofolate cyclodeaminase
MHHSITGGLCLKPLIESICHFSEGQRLAVVDELVETITRSGGVHLLEINRDIDQNRTAITLVGLPMEVEKSVMAGIRLACELIDMTTHRGSHPRFGAADLITFVPIRDVTIDQTVELAHRLGRRAAAELHLPVYFFGEAVRRFGMEDSADFCHIGFQYEQLQEHIRLDPAWMPDAGPAEIGTAGASLIGANLPWLECLVELVGNNLSAAQALAETVDDRTGGLRHVRCHPEPTENGIRLRLKVMNISKTPLYRAVELLRREAARHNLQLSSLKIVGLIPEVALVESAEWYLQLDGFSSQSILEQRIRQAEAELTNLAEEEPPIPEDATSQIVLPSANEARRPELFPSMVAQATPTPGGGAVAALVGALAASLTEMVAGLTIGRKNYEGVQDIMLAIQATAYNLRNQLLDAVSQDMDAFTDLLATVRQARDNPSLEEAIQQKTLRTAEVPLQVIRLAYEVLELIEQVVKMGNRNAVIDAAVGARMALAVIESSALNARVNLMSITDEGLTSHFLDELDHILQTVPPLCQNIIAIASERVGLTEAS